MKHNKSINDYYNNYLSHNYIDTVNQSQKSSNPEIEAKLELEDLNFSNHRGILPKHYNLSWHTRNPILRDKTLNLLKADEYNRKQAKKAFKNIFSVIHDSIKGGSNLQVFTYVLRPTANSKTIKLKGKDGVVRNFERISKSRKGYYYSAEYKRMINYKGKLLRIFRQLGLIPLISSIESIQYYLYLFVHNQGIIATSNYISGNNTKLANKEALIIQNKLIRATRKDIAVKPLRQPEKTENRRKYSKIKGTSPDDYGNPVIFSKDNMIDYFNPHKPTNPEVPKKFNNYNVRAIQAITYYLYKQYKLPVAYGDNKKAKRAVNRFIKLSPSERLAIIDAIKNSTYKKQLHYHISYKRTVNKVKTHKAKHLKQHRTKLHKVHMLNEFETESALILPKRIIYNVLTKAKRKSTQNKTEQIKSELKFRSLPVIHHQYILNIQKYAEIEQNKKTSIKIPVANQRSTTTTEWYQYRSSGIPP